MLEMSSRSAFQKIIQAEKLSVTVLSPMQRALGLTGNAEIPNRVVWYKVDCTGLASCSVLCRDQRTYLIQFPTFARLLRVQLVEAVQPGELE